MPTHSTRFSLADLLVAVAAASLILGAYVSTDFFTTCGTVLVLALVAPRLRGDRTTRQFSKRCRTIAGLAGATMVLQLAFCALFSIGPVLSTASWPRELHALSAFAGAPASQVKMYCLGGFLDYEYVCRVPVQREKLEDVLSWIEGEWGGELIEGMSQEAAFKFKQRFPWRWRPMLREETTFYASRYNELSMMYDPTSEQLYVYYFLDF